MISIFIYLLVPCSLSMFSVHVRFPFSVISSVALHIPASVSQFPIHLFHSFACKPITQFSLFYILIIFSLKFIIYIIVYSLFFCVLWAHNLFNIQCFRLPSRLILTILLDFILLKKLPKSLTYINKLSLQSIFFKAH